MFLILFTKLVILWTGIITVLPIHVVTDKISISSQRDMRTFINNPSFVPKPEGSRSTNGKRKEAGTLALDTVIAEQLPSTRDTDRNTRNSLAVPIMKSTGLNFKTNLKEFLTSLYIPVRPPSPHFNNVCTFKESLRHTSVERPCGVDTNRMKINYHCGISCGMKGETNCEIINCIPSYQCSWRAYIALSNLCDGSQDCTYRDDETNCMNPTSNYCSCIGVTINSDNFAISNSSSKHKKPLSMESIRMSLPNITHIRSISSLSYLIIQHCSREQLTSIFQWCHTEGCSKLGYVDVSNSDLSGNTAASMISGLSRLEVLRLSDSNISDLPGRVFRGQPLRRIDLSSNKISSLHIELFHGLLLRRIDLSSNRIYSLPVGVFYELPLNILDLSSNRMSFIHEDSFNGLPLQELDLSSNSILSISEGVFYRLPLKKLDLSFNRISSLHEDIFNNLPLRELDLSSNRISSIPDNVFHGLPLQSLNLSSNRISSLPIDVFRGLPLKCLYLSSNRISSIPGSIFHKLSLVYLSLASNRISYLPVGVFSHQPISTLDLSSNRLSSLSRGVLKEWTLRFRTILDLSRNKIFFLPTDVFNGISVNKLDLSSNRISSLSVGVFRGLHCRYLSLANNGLVHIPDGSFMGVTLVEILVLNHNYLEVTEHMFKGLNDLTHLIIDTYMLCCVKPDTVSYGNCLATSDNRTYTEQDSEGYVYRGVDCSAPTTAISSCTSIIGSDVLRAFLWIIAFVALVGNTAVIVYRLVNDKKNLLKTHSICVLNLSLSDVLMGVYLLIIGAADVHYRGVYAWNDQKWRHSTLCITAGILSTISSEMSTFIILLISIDRFMVLVFPFSRHRIGWRQAIWASFALWIIAFILSVIPQVTLHSYFRDGFYSKSGVCLALPLTDDTDGVEYSMFVFVGLNSCVFVVIMLGHIGICKSISSSTVANTLSRRRDIAVAKTLFLVVATDFCCWIPIGIMGILSQVGIQTPDNIYSWVMIFVLPINSAINPFIYTFIYVWKTRKDSRGNRMVNVTTQSS